MMADGKNEFIVLLNFQELIFIFFDMWYYHSEKINKHLCVLERILYLFVFNTSLLELEYTALLACAGIGFGFITLIKLYYVVTSVMKWCENKGKEEEEIYSSSAG